jgi:hypothetical protein
MDYASRFIVGGLMVSLFAIVGDVLRPKSFAGLFAAASSVALGISGDLRRQRDASRKA